MKKMSIEELLNWAFTHELCKEGVGGNGVLVAGSSWESVAVYGQLGTVIDRTNRYGVLPGFIEAGDPAADAVIVGNAVRSIAAMSFEIPAGWNPFPEWADEYGLIAADVQAVVERVLLKGDVLSGRHVVGLVISAAILGRGPDWRAEEPGVRFVTRAGKPAWFIERKAKDCFGKVYLFENDGLDRKRNRPMAKAYRKYELDASIVGATLSRLDWQLWQDALAVLSERLAGKLQAVDLLPFRAARQPWHSRHRSESCEVIENA